MIHRPSLSNSSTATTSPKRPALPPLIMASTVFPNSSYQAPVEPYAPSDKTSFAYTSVTKRWPLILTNIIDRIVSENNLLLDQLRSTTTDDNTKGALVAKIKEGKQIISQISELKYESARDKPIGPLKDDQGANVQLYNEELAKTKAADRPTWFNASWLFSECYLYRRISTLFQLTEHWRSYDPFEHSKLQAFRSSLKGIVQLTLRFDQFIHPRSSESEIEQESFLKRKKFEFEQLMLASLWGNATDLSLLPNLNHEEIQKLQLNNEVNQRIIKNDLEVVWDVISPSILSQQTRELGRIDFVLDNAGFEVFTDFVLADWITTFTKSKIVFHPKSIPWFVSDVMQKDINQLLAILSNPHEFFYAADGDQGGGMRGEGSKENRNEVEEGVQAERLGKLGKRWRAHFESGAWEVCDSKVMDFWTNPLPFWDIVDQDGKLLDELKRSNLVIFKGDLNYRKLTGDAKWKSTTSFREAIGPLDGLFNLVSLRTCKADVVVGLREGQEEELNALDPDWRINGRFGMISFSGKR